MRNISSEMRSLEGNALQVTCITQSGYFFVFTSKVTDYKYFGLCNQITF